MKPAPPVIRIFLIMLSHRASRMPHRRRRTQAPRDQNRDLLNKRDFIAMTRDTAAGVFANAQAVYGIAKLTFR